MNDHLVSTANQIESVKAHKLGRGYLYVATLRDGKEFVLRNGTRIYANLFTYDRGFVTAQNKPWSFGQKPTFNSPHPVQLTGTFPITLVQ